LESNPLGHRYISAKEPYISAKEHYISAKEPYISRAYVSLRASLAVWDSHPPERRNCKRALYLRKRALYLLKRALYLRKRALYLCKNNG